MIFFSNAQLNSEYYEYDFNVSVKQMQNVLKRYYSKKSGRVNVLEYGYGNKRFDMFSIEPKKKWIIIHEIKSGKWDFLSDKKWKSYLEYCNQFIFVCPYDAIKKEELPKEAGLMYAFRYRRKPIDDNDKSNWWTGLKIVKHSMKRNIYKETYYKLLERTLIKAKYGRIF